jgi:Family of unknown function (DUF6790)
MAAAIGFILSNFTLTFLVLGLVASGVSLMRKPRPWPAAVIVESLFSFFLLFSIGLSNVYSFVMHVSFGDTAARFIGWAPSPFQAEVGFASLGFGLVGLLAYHGSYGLRIGAVVGTAGFLFGAAGGHVYQMIAAHNFAPGNAGIILYTDIAIPLAGFLLLWLQRRYGSTR